MSFVYVVSGEVTLVTDEGEQVLRAGLVAGFPGGVEDGHCIQNRSDALAVILEVGTRDPDDEGHYPDDDLLARKDGAKGHIFTTRDGKLLG